MTAPTQPLTCPPSGVLLVGGVPDDLPVLETALTGSGGVVRACSGEEALRRLGERDFTVAVLDLQTPGLDGLRTARLIRSRVGVLQTPILLLLARDGADFPLAEAYGLGAVDHLTRPIIPEVLRAKVAPYASADVAWLADARYVERLRILNQMDRALIAGDSPAAIAAAALVPLRNLLGVPRVIVNLFDLARGEVEWLAAAGRRRVRVGPGVRYSIRLMGNVEALQRGELQSVDVHALPPGPEAEALLASGVQAYVVVPMIAGNVLIGALSFGGESLPLSEDQLAVAREAAAQFAIALAQARLHERVKRQAEELQARSAERDQAEQELREAARRKDAFLAMLAHELRNPLAPIRNALHILQLSGGDGSVVDQVRGMMERQVHHLGRLVDDLLDISRITLGKVQLRMERLDLARVAGQSVEANRDAFVARSVGLRVEVPETPVWVSGDATRLTQVLDNLLDNALKFTAEGGEVAVAVTASGDGRHAAVAVRDSGVGIQPEMLPQLFETFSQADRTLDRSQGGLGLGLAIVKSLSELHGGSVRAESAGLGRGASFTVTLPRVEEPAALSVAPAPAAPTGRHLRVLVVEDNRDAADSLCMLLRLCGYEVAAAYTGPDGVRAAQQRCPEVVICDIGLPGMDGYRVAKTLRGNPTTASARLVALTGYGQEEDRRRAREAGFDEHLTKPADPMTLQRILAQAGAARA
jgi:signal transduction histidine kinase